MLVYKKVIGLSILFFYIANSAALYDDTDKAITDRPLRILFVVGNFPAPSQIFILNIITGLIDAGHDVSIFSFRKGDKKGVLHPNIKKYHLLKRVTYREFPAILPDYDIVFCQFGYIGQKVLAMKRIRKWLKERKFVVCFRGSDITKRIQENPTVYKNMFNHVDLVLPVCDYFKQRLISLGCPPDKIVVHHSAIDCSQFFFNVKEKPENDTIHLISVCRLVKKKGIDYAIKAFAQVVEKHPNIHFTIVGDGPERTYLELLIRQLRLENKISLHGWASQEAIVSLLRNSHIFLLPSRVGPDGNEEGIPNALKEAMAMGLICVATWHAGNPELIENGVSGFLVPERTKIELAQTINHIIEHPERWESIALAARKKVENEFETKKSIEKLEEIFYKLLI
jgi:colanic acid/amylovoran biosynthesis glycosyltransferase